MVISVLNPIIESSSTYYMYQITYKFLPGTNSENGISFSMSALSIRDEDKLVLKTGPKLESGHTVVPVFQSALKIATLIFRGSPWNVKDIKK